MHNTKSEMIKALYRRDLGAEEGGARSKFRLTIRAAARISLAMVLVSQLIVIGYFNKFVTMQQDIFAQGALIEVEYQRRENLVPRLAEISKEYARHERELMNYTSDARAVKKYSDKLKAAVGPAKSAQMDRVVSKLIALAEQYPNLKAEQSYQALMAKIVITENRVASAREEYVRLINEYNRTVQTFPYATFAMFLKFEKINVYMPEKELAPGKDKRFFFIY